MTTAALTPAIDYLEDGSTVAFPVPFRFNAPSDVRAERLGSNELRVPLVYGADYSVTGGASDSGGTLTVTAAAAAGTKLSIWRETARDQQTDYADGDTFPAASHEAALDKLTLQSQESDVDHARAPKVPRGETAPDIEPKVTRAGKVALWAAVTGALASVSFGALAAELAAPLLPYLPSAFKGNPGSPGEGYATRVALALAGVGASDLDDAFLTEKRRAGKFVFTSDDISAQVAIDTQQALYVPHAGDPTGASGGWVRDFVGPMKAEWFGAVTGAADDTGPLQAAAAALSGGLHNWLRIDGTHLITNSLKPTDANNWLIDGKGSLKVKDGTATGQDNAVIEVTRCHGWKIDGVAIDGNRANREPSEASGHLVRVRESNRWMMTNMIIQDGTTDGIYIYSSSPADSTTHCCDFAMENVRVSGCYRQGMSVIQAHRAVFRRCAWSFTSGTAPQAGVDLESNSADAVNSITDISFENCTFEGNAGYGLLVASAKVPQKINVNRSLFKSNVAGAVNWNGTTGALVDCVFDGFDGNTATRGLIDQGAIATAKDLSVIRARFENIVNQTSGKPLFYTHSSSGGGMLVEDTHESAAAYVANFNADNAQMIGGKYTGCKSPGVVMGKLNALAQRVTFSGFEYDAIRLSGDGSTVSGCRFIEPTLNDAQGCLRVTGGSRLRIEGNRFYRAASAAGTVIGIPAGATVALMVSNQSNGFTGTPVANAGTIRVNRATLIDGVLQPETPLAA